MPNTPNISVQNLEQVYNQIRKTQSEVIKTLNQFNSELLAQTQHTLNSVRQMQRMGETGTPGKTKGQIRPGGAKEEEKDEGFFKTFAKEFKKQRDEQRREAKAMKDKLAISNKHLAEIPKEKDGFFKSLLRASPYLLAAIPLLPALTQFAQNSLFPMVKRLIPEEFKPLLKDLATEIGLTFDIVMEKMKPYFDSAKEWLKGTLWEIAKSPAVWKAAGIGIAIATAPAIATALIVPFIKALGPALLKGMVIPLALKLSPLLAPLLPALAPIAGVLATTYFAVKNIQSLVGGAQEAREAAQNRIELETDNIRSLEQQLEQERSKGAEANQERLKMLEEAIEIRKELRDSKAKEDSYFAPMINYFQRGKQEALEEKAAKREEALFDMMITDRRELLQEIRAHDTEEGAKAWEMTKERTQMEIKKLIAEGKIQAHQKADVELDIQNQILRQIAHQLKQGQSLQNIQFSDDSHAGSETSTITGPTPMRINSPKTSSEQINYVKLLAKAREAEKEGRRKDHNIEYLKRKSKLIPFFEENSYLNRIEALQSGANQFMGATLGLNRQQSSITSGFGKRLHQGSPDHRGWDFLTPIGTPLKSPFDMRLLSLRRGGRGGNEAIFDVNGYQVGFSHLQRTLLSNKDIGKTVPRGEKFAFTGDTGGVPPHLHVGVKDEMGRPVNFLKDSAQVWKNLMQVEADVDEKKKFRADSVDPMDKMLGELEAVFGENFNLKNSLDILKYAGFSNLINFFGGQIGGLGSLDLGELVGPLNNIVKNTKKDTNVII